VSTSTNTPAIPARYASEFVAAGHAYGIDPADLAGVAWVESRFGANRGPSSAGAIGLMQFMPGTAAGLGIDPRDDRAAIWGAAKLLKQYGYGSDRSHALSSYNAGPAAAPAARAQGNAYARDVETWADRFRPDLAGSSTSTTSSTRPSSAPASTSTGSIAATLTRLLLMFVLVAAGGVLVFVGARSALSATPAIRGRA
jgi:soluble lytic murein transglycosylase-like protein